mmetsp:Transcript_59728/g.69823  ORF Transcript_59728/g.69823 Transcript_59728/m.69823 type:complete len:81 (+) Transcript_59728:209-451(+)
MTDTESISFFLFVRLQSTSYDFCLAKGLSSVNWTRRSASFFSMRLDWNTNDAVGDGWQQQHLHIKTQIGDVFDYSVSFPN